MITVVYMIADVLYDRSRFMNNNVNMNELKEKSHHGTKEFPIQVYHPTGLMAHYHWHEECEFIYINAGSACIRIGVDSFDLNEGDCVYVKPNELHSISTEDTKEFDFYAVVFHPSFILFEMDVCSRFLSTKYVIQNCFYHNDAGCAINDTIKLLCETFESKSFAYELKIKALLYTVFTHIFERGCFHTADYHKENKATDKLEKVIKYIHTNFASPIKVEELAEVSGYSVSHFTHYFKELTGKTPVEYINLRRIYYACELLKKTDLSILEVSLDCGFEHVGYFIKTFKKYTDFTPYKYRQKNNRV
jgi:AraC-like DNA-binding protein/mannose-6-phosphate isomerase-like protein (cupin superfamily)